MELHKTTIVIWTDYDPRNYEIEDLAREATSGDAYCSLQKSELVLDPERDPHAPSIEFFSDER